jgi:hypothetical protein
MKGGMLSRTTIGEDMTQRLSPRPETSVEHRLFGEVIASTPKTLVDGPMASVLNLLNF